MRIISLGGGVQSTTMLLMSILGDLEPTDGAIFADTQWEPKAVYEHMEWLREFCKNHSYPLLTVTAGNLKEHVLEMVRTNKEFPGIPLHMVDDNGKKSMLRRQCTFRYKIVPINKQIRALAGMTRRPWKGEPCEQWLGISIDEALRMRDNKEHWIKNRYPLIENHMTRDDCVEWLTSHNFPEPPKSSCLGCPYHGDAQWKFIYDSSPEEFQETIEFDESIRRIPRMTGEAFVHGSSKPLRNIDFEDRPDTFSDECSGICEV